MGKVFGQALVDTPVMPNRSIVREQRKPLQIRLKRLDIKACQTTRQTADSTRVSALSHRTHAASLALLDLRGGHVGPSAAMAKRLVSVLRGCA